MSLKVAWISSIKQLSALGVNTTEIITDKGYYSESNLFELLQTGFDFITLAKTGRVDISTKLHNRRWNTEITACDAMYLRKIGLDVD